MTEIVQIIGRATRDAVGKTKARFTNLIAEPDAGEQAVTEAVNDTLKAIAASLLMEQVLAPRFEFRPKTPTNLSGGPLPGLDYGADGYDPGGCNVGMDPSTGGVQIEINGLVEPESDEATRICREDLNEVLASFVQDTRTVQDGLFNDELPPQETTQQRMGKIIRDKYPDLPEQDQEAIRQRAVAALNLIQMGGKKSSGSGATSNTALIDGIRRYVTDVRDLNVDLIDSINPFGEAYNILAKTMNEERLRQVQSAIAGRRVQLTAEEARDLAKRALKFKNKRGRLPSITSQDAWERRMAEGIAFLSRMKQEKALVAETGEWFTPEHGERDRRLRVIFDNGTESDLLLRSLRRALNKDENSRRIVPQQAEIEEDFSDLGPLFSNVIEDGDCESGAIYVARSLFDNPFVQENRELLHKIGLTTGDPEKRVSNAKKETTYLFAAVELVAVYRLANINCKAFESLLHKFLARARIDLALADRFGGKIQPREWFLVPLPVVEEVVERIKDGSISDYVFDVETASMRRRGK